MEKRVTLVLLWRAFQKPSLRAHRSRSALIKKKIFYNTLTFICRVLLIFKKKSINIFLKAGWLQMKVGSWSGGACTASNIISGQFEQYLTKNQKHWMTCHFRIQIVHCDTPINQGELHVQVRNYYEASNTNEVEVCEFSYEAGVMNQKTAFVLYLRLWTW